MTMKTVVGLLFCALVLSILQGSLSIKCTRALTLPNCEDNKCKDKCLEVFGSRTYYFICGCRGSTTSCQCLFECNPPKYKMELSG